MSSYFQRTRLERFNPLNRLIMVGMAVFLQGPLHLYGNNCCPHVEFGGSARTRYEIWNGGDVVPASNAWKTGIDDDYTVLNIKTHALIELSDCFSLFGEVEYPRIFGSKFINSRYYSRGLHLHQFYCKLYYDEYTLILGRQTLDYGSSLVIGTDYYQNNTFSYDVFRVDWEGEYCSLSAFFGQDDFEEVFFSSETNERVAGCYFSHLGKTFQFDQYLLYREFGRCAENYLKGKTTRQVFWIGTRGKGECRNIEADVEFVKQFGDRQGWAFHGVADWYLKPEHYSHPILFVATNVASGSDKFKDNYEPFYAARQIYRRSHVQTSLINIIEVGTGLKIYPLPKQPILLTLAGWEIWKFDKKGAIFSWDSVHAWFLPSVERHLGEVVSATLEYDLEKCNTVLKGYASYYVIGSAIRENPDTHNTGFYYLSLEFHF